MFAQLYFSVISILYSLHALFSVLKVFPGVPTIGFTWLLQGWLHKTHLKSLYNVLEPDVALN